MKRAVGVADGRHAVGETRERQALKRAVTVADCRHAVGDKEVHAMKRAVVVADCRHAGEIQGRGMPSRGL